MGRGCKRSRRQCAQMDVSLMGSQGIDRHRILQGPGSMSLCMRRGKGVGLNAVQTRSSTWAGRVMVCSAPAIDVQPNAYPRFNGDMGFKVVGPPRVHMHETSATCGRVVDPARANSIYRGSEVETSDALGYGGCTALLSPVVLRSDSCAAGFAAFAVGLATNMFPRMEPTVDCLKSMSDATRAKDHSTRAAALKAAGCTMMSDDDTETLNRLRAYRVALNFGYKVFLIHKMYAEDMLGHVGEVKRSDYNVAQCQSKRSDVNAKTYGTLNQMRMLETADFEERLNSVGPPLAGAERGAVAPCFKVAKRQANDGLGPTENYSTDWVRNSGTGYSASCNTNNPVLHEPHSKSLYFRLLCQVPEAHDMGLCAMQAPRNFHPLILSGGEISTCMFAGSARSLRSGWKKKYMGNVKGI